jgi:hypothetical protein
MLNDTKRDNSCSLQFVSTDDEDKIKLGRRRVEGGNTQSIFKLEHNTDFLIHV